MANILVSVRLSSRLAKALDRAADYLECTPSQLVEALLRASEAHHKAILDVPVEGPFAQKRNLRLSPEAMTQLRRLAGYRHVHAGEFVFAIEHSVYVRSMLAYFFSSPRAFQAVLPNALPGEEWARLLEEDKEQIPKTSKCPRAAHPRGSWIGILLLSAVLILLLFEILDLVKQPMPRNAPPPKKPSPSPTGGQGRLAGDEDHRPERSSEEGT